MSLAAKGSVYQKAALRKRGHEESGSSSAGLEGGRRGGLGKKTKREEKLFTEEVQQCSTEKGESPAEIAARKKLEGSKWRLGRFSSFSHCSE